MINRVYWDLDETLIHTHDEDYIKHDFEFDLDSGGWGGSYSYKTKIRPGAQEVIDYSRSLVGAENVWILTASIIDYATIINHMAGFGFRPDQIIAREHQKNHLESKWHRHPDNVLIDNLRPFENTGKMGFIGIDKDNYLRVKDYYGIDFSDSSFVNDCIKFLNRINKKEL